MRVLPHARNRSQSSFVTMYSYAVQMTQCLVECLLFGALGKSSVESVQRELSEAAASAMTSSVEPLFTLRVNDTVLSTDVKNMTTEMSPLCPRGTMPAADNDYCGMSSILWLSFCTA